MRTFFTVFVKEVIDNFRDRRTLASALIMGPLFGPMLFAFVINLSIERSLDDLERTMELPVIGAEHAPNLMRYLASHNIDVVVGPNHEVSPWIDQRAQRHTPFGGRSASRFHIT